MRHNCNIREEISIRSIIQRTENPRVGGSIPPLGTSLHKGLANPCGLRQLSSNQSATELFADNWIAWYERPFTISKNCYLPECGAGTETLPHAVATTTRAAPKERAIIAIRSVLLSKKRTTRSSRNAQIRLRNNPDVRLRHSPEVQTVLMNVRYPG